MTTLLAPARTARPAPADLAAMFLRDRGYDARTVEASASDLAVIDPADAASVRRILGDAPPAAHHPAGATPPAPGADTPAPPTYSDDPRVEAAVSEARACLFPASAGYMRNMRTLADRGERRAAIIPEAAAPAADPTTDPGDTECDPRDWPAWTDERWTTVAPELEPAPRPRPFEPTPAERSWWAAECERLASPRAPRWPGLIPRGLAETIARTSPVGHDA